MHWLSFRGFPFAWSHFYPGEWHARILGYGFRWRNYRKRPDWAWSEAAHDTVIVRDKGCVFGFHWPWDDTYRGTIRAIRLGLFDNPPRVDQKVLAEAVGR